MSGDKFTNGLVSDYNGESRCCCCARLDVSATRDAVQDTVNIDQLKSGTEILGQQSIEVVPHGSGDSCSSRNSTLVDIDIGKATRDDLSTEDKCIVLGLTTFHVVMVLTNVTLAAALLQRTQPNTAIQDITVMFSLFATYFDPLAIVVVIAIWNRIVVPVRVGLFTIRFAFILASAIMTGRDAASCFKVANLNAKSPCQMITALSVLLCISLPVLAFEILAIGIDIDKEKEDKAKVARLRIQARKATREAAEVV